MYLLGMSPFFEAEFPASSSVKDDEEGFATAIERKTNDNEVEFIFGLAFLVEI